MNCSLCGHSFKPEDHAHTCKGCPLAGNCERVRCPNCGFETVPDPAWLRRLAKWWQHRTAPAAPAVPPAPAPRNRTLAELPAGNGEYLVASLAGASPEMLRRLAVLGLLPGVRVRVEQTFPAYVLVLGRTKFAVDRELASQVQVLPFRPIPATVPPAPARGALNAPASV